MDMQTPKRVKAKIVRTVTEIAIVELDRDGQVDEVHDILDELEYEDCELRSIHSVIDVYPH